MNWHQLIEERSYEMHQVVAEMRHSSPFAVVMPQDERMRILRRY